MKNATITPGTEIEANVTSGTSFYKKVIGTVQAIKGDFIQIKATKVISKWSKEYKDHPTSCAMSVKASDIIRTI